MLKSLDHICETRQQNVAKYFALQSQEHLQMMCQSHSEKLLKLRWPILPSIVGDKMKWMEWKQEYWERLVTRYHETKWQPFSPHSRTYKFQSCNCWNKQTKEFLLTFVKLAYGMIIHLKIFTMLMKWPWRPFRNQRKSLLAEEPSNLKQFFSQLVC